MISESHSDWNRWPGPLQPPLPLEVVRELAVVHDGDVGERVGPVGVGARDVDVRLGRHAHVADGVGAGEVGQVVLVRHRLGVAQVLHDLERVAQRQHLAAGHVLEVVGELLQVAGIGQHRPQRVVGLVLDRLDRCAQLAHARLDLGPVALEPFGELEVARVVGVGQLVPDEDRLRCRPEEGVAGRVGAAVLHRLEHAGHVTADVLRAVPIDDSCNSAHTVSLSRLSGDSAW